MPLAPQATSSQVPRHRLYGLRRGIGVFWIALQLLVLAGAAALLIAWKGFGYVPLVVQSGSMEPAISPGSIIFVTATDPTAVRPGDILTFDPPGPRGRTTHRVSKTLEWEGQRFFVTKGDANPDIDRWKGMTESSVPDGVDPDLQHAVTYRDGKAQRMAGAIPWAGWVAIPASHGWFRMLLIAVPLALLGFMAMRWIWQPAANPTDFDHDTQPLEHPEPVADDPAA